MFIVKETDTAELDYYKTIEDVYMNCEGIDVNNGLYEFSDDEGNIYDVEWIEEVKTEKFIFGLVSMTQGKYRLIRRD